MPACPFAKQALLDEKVAIIFNLDLQKGHCGNFKLSADLSNKFVLEKYKSGKIIN